MAEVYERSYSIDRKFSSEHFRVRLDGVRTNEYYPSATLAQTGNLNGFKNPYWREQVRMGLPAGTELEASRVRHDHGRYHIEEIGTYVSGTPLPHYNKDNFSYGNYYISNPYLGGLSTAALEAEANNKAMVGYLKQAEEARRVLLSGESIGEYAELVRQVGSPAKSLRKGLGSYVESVKKRTQRPSVRRLPPHRRSDVQAKIVSDTWLEYQFGWRPLVNDVNDVIDYVNETDPFSRYDNRKIKSSAVAESASWENSNHTQLTPGPPAIAYRRRRFMKVIVVYRGHVNMSNSSAGYVAEKVGFHPTQWVPTAWELIPYSFLIDYFSNIGDIIQALSFPTSRLAWSLKTTITEKNGRFIEPKVIWTGPASGCAGSLCWVVDRRVLSLGGVSHTVRTVKRTRMIGSLIPDLTFQVPNSGTKWLNMAALFLGSRYVEKLLK